ncbi:MAG TPA: hypothetical protein VF487_10065 [Chitinophagaceae bacterium]
MKKIILFACLFSFLCCLSSFAFPASVPATSTASVRITEPPSPFNAGISQLREMNFVEKLVWKMMVKKIQKKMKKWKIDEADANKQATLAKTMGLISLAAFFLFPLAAIPFALIAIDKGTQALANGTTLPRKARAGRTMGIISIALILAVIFLVIIIITGFSFA